MAKAMSNPNPNPDLATIIEQWLKDEGIEHRMYRGEGPLSYKTTISFNNHSWLTILTEHVYWELHPEDPDFFDKLRKLVKDA